MMQRVAFTVVAVVAVFVVLASSADAAPTNAPCNLNGFFSLGNGTKASCSTLKSVEERAKHAGCRCSAGLCCSKFSFCGKTDFYCLEKWGCEKRLGGCKDAAGKPVGDGSSSKPSNDGSNKSNDNNNKSLPTQAPKPQQQTDKTPPMPSDDPNDPKNIAKVIVKTISVACPTCKKDTPKSGGVKVSSPKAAQSKKDGVPNAVDEGAPKVCDSDKDPGCINAAKKSLANNIPTPQAAQQQQQQQQAPGAAQSRAGGKAQAVKETQNAGNAASPNLSIVPMQGDHHRKQQLLSGPI